MLDSTLTRRDVLRAGTAGLLSSAAPILGRVPLFAQERGERPIQSDTLKIVTPRRRVPISFIIDDSACLANFAYFGIPHFAEVYPDRYRQDWAKLLKEIPDTFVRKFGEWSREHGIKGKYSIAPYPACIGRIDQKLLEWSKQSFEESLKLVREFMTVDWDIHPEMVTHTFAIDVKTGKPYPDRTEDFLENTGFSRVLTLLSPFRLAGSVLACLRSYGAERLRRRCRGGGRGSRGNPRWWIDVR